MSNEEFIEISRKAVLAEGLVKGINLKLGGFLTEALDRLDALVKANEDRDLTVAKEALEAIFQADKFGEIADHVKFRNKRMTAAEVCKIGLAQFAAADKAEKEDEE